MLSGYKIEKEFDNGRIIIDPFNIENLGVNSYDLALGNTLLSYDLGKDRFIDTKKYTPMSKQVIPEEGLILDPGRLYLGSTVERFGSNYYIPGIDGRSSIARLGMFVHISAGFGDIGFTGRWTLEIICHHRIKVYPGLKIAQGYFFKPEGSSLWLYDGKYKGKDKDAEGSKLYEEFQDKGLTCF